MSLTSVTGSTSLAGKRLPIVTYAKRPHPTMLVLSEVILHGMEMGVHRDYSCVKTKNVFSASLSATVSKSVGMAAMRGIAVGVCNAISYF